MQTYSDRRAEQKYSNRNADVHVFIFTDVNHILYDCQFQYTFSHINLIHALYVMYVGFIKCHYSVQV